jgi:hypothetical protein
MPIASLAKLFPAKELSLLDAFLQADNFVFSAYRNGTVMYSTSKKECA